MDSWAEEIQQGRNSCPRLQFGFQFGFHRVVAPLSLLRSISLASLFPVDSIFVHVNQNSTFSTSVFKALNACAIDANLIPLSILVPRGPAPFGQHQESRPLARSKSGSPRFTDFPSLCACSEKRLTNLIASGLNLLCLQVHSKPECCWTGPEVAILGADQKERGLWGRECHQDDCVSMRNMSPL